MALLRVKNRRAFAENAK